MRPHRQVRLSPAAVARVWCSQTTEQRLLLCLDAMAFHAARKNVPYWLFWRWLFDLTVLSAHTESRAA